MRRAFIFKPLCMVMVWVYCAVTAQAGQVVTQKERAWAKQVLDIAESEKNLAQLGASNTMAVLNFNNKTGLEDLNALQKGMAIMLITDLSKVGSLQVVERIKIQALLDEMNLGTTGLVDSSTAPKVGRLLRAHYISTGDIDPGQQTKLDITPVLVDIPLEKFTPQTPTSGDIQDMFRMEKGILAGIIAQVKAQPTAKEQVELDKPLAANPSAALSFFIGVDLSDKGKYTEAAGMYEKALLEDPHFTLAKDALQELKTLGLTSSGASAATGAVEDGSTRKNVSLVVLGLLAAGGAGLALSGGGGGGGGGTAQGPVIVSTNPVAGSALNLCSTGSISFIFNENIYNCANVSFAPTLTIGGQSVASEVLTVPYGYTTGLCDFPTTNITATVSGCQDVQGHPMTPRNFTFTN